MSAVSTLVAPSAAAERKAVGSAAPVVPTGLCCPDCRASLAGEPPGPRCPGCGRPVTVRFGALVDFLGGDCAGVLASWTGEALERASTRLADLDAGRPLEAESVPELAALGFAGPDGSLTPLGAKLSYHALEYQWQSRGDQMRSLLDRAGLGPGARVLDVGCGAGQTLRLLASRRPAERIGIDLDLEALAFGRRLADRDGGPGPYLLRGAGERLPFGEARFTHVICRVALNYMHQATALRELTRVLEPGGLLCCRVETLGFDLRLVRSARGPRQLLCRLRDLTWGAVHALTGWQRPPGTRGGGGRAFASVRRLRLLLGRLGCRVLAVQTMRRSPPCLGAPSQVALLARRGP
jgi:SAM-dependent methyltransferase